EIELRVFLRRSGAAEPGGQALVALADTDAEAAAGPVEGGRGTGTPVAVALAQGGQLAVVDQAADCAEHSAALVAQQCQRIARFESKCGVERTAAGAPARAAAIALGGGL